MKTTYAESPLYYPETDSLYYTDATGTDFQLLRYDFAENKIYTAKIEGAEGRVGFMIPIEGRCDKFLVSLKLKLIVVKWDGKSPTAKIYCTQMENDKDVPPNFFHNGFVDSHNRLFMGTVNYHLCNPNDTSVPGGLFRSDDGKTIQSTMIPKMKINNDFAIDEEKKVLYVANSCIKTIEAYGNYQFALTQSNFPCFKE